MPDVSSTTPPERPWLFGLLIAPMAVLANGLFGGALSYLLRQHGVGPAREGEIAALLTLPATIYFLWSPLTDFWMRRRTWIIVAATAAAVSVVIAFRQSSLAGSRALGLMFISACLGQLVVAGCGGMMGALKSETNRRRAGSFYQSGSLAFGAGAVLALVLLSARYRTGVLGWIAAAMIVLPSLAALAAPEDRYAGGASARKTFAQIWREFKSTFLRWEAIPYTLVVTFPMSSGAMISLLPGLAADYRIGGQQVAWINGLVGALLMAAGALATTLISSRMRTPVAYLLVGLANAASLAIMWLGPLRPLVYFAGVIPFLLTVGAGYALFTGVVLEFLGGSGKSGSARYAIINSLGNIPVVYMALIDGKSYAHWGARAMPGADAVVSAIGATLLLVYFLSHPDKEQQKDCIEVANEA